MLNAKVNESSEAMNSSQPPDATPYSSTQALYSLREKEIGGGYCCTVLRSRLPLHGQSYSTHTLSRVLSSRSDWLGWPQYD
jgi:hypothetical protein